MRAVCLACGELKYGALALCPRCDHLPTEQMDQARHLLACEQTQQPEALAALARRIEDGEVPEFPTEELERAAAAIDSVGEVGLGLYALAVGAAPVLVITGILVLSVWLMISR